MIGILNTGGEYTEFYATNPASSSQSIFTGTAGKPKVTYSKGGRVFVNGEPQVKINPKELWDNLLTRAISNSAIVSTLKAAGLESKSNNATTNEIMDFRKANSEANLPELVITKTSSQSTTTMASINNETHHHFIRPLKIFRRHRRSSSC